jgi:hypothetical protein
VRSSTRLPASALGSSARSAAGKQAHALTVDDAPYAYLAALGALVVYVATASGGSYWLDGGEIVAASITLDIIHPPGHPLTALWGKAFSLVPLGALPFRIALGQAVAAALGAGFFCRALCRLGAVFELAPGVRGPLALAFSALVAFSFGVWFQAVRPEVYALQALLLMVAMERLMALACGGFLSIKALLAACVAVGLGLSNHHLMSFFFFMPLAVATLYAIARHRRSALRALRVLALCTLAGGIGLAAYVYLPVRAATDPPLNLGNPVTLERIHWVVSAQVYAREMGDDNPQPMDERYLDVLVVLVEELGFACVLLALAGVYLGLRMAHTRALSLLWIITAASVLLVRPWLGPVRGNPDSVGYLIAGLCAVAALGFGGLCALFALYEAARTGTARARGIATGLLIAIAGQQLVTQAARASLADFASTEAFDDARHRALPPRAIVVATTPQTVFRQLELEAVEHARPDVALLALPFLRYPGVAESSARRTAELAPLVRSFLALDRLEAGALQTLAGKRPAFVELDTNHIAPSDYASLEPQGALYAARCAQCPAEALEASARTQSQAMVRLERALGPALADADARRLLLWLRYMDALYFAARGAQPAALAALRAAERLYPHDAHLQAMLHAVIESERASPHAGPMDIRPFLRLDSAHVAP